MSNRNKAHSQSLMMAYCGMTAALSAALMVTGTLIPIMTYAAPLACGLLLLPVMIEFGKKAAWLTWAAAALVITLLGPDREAAFFYLFLGYYPILHWELEKIPHKGLRLLVKAGIFAIAMGVMYWLLMAVMHMDAIAAEFREMGKWMTIAFFAVTILMLLIWDRMLWPMCQLYSIRIRPKLRFLRKQ